MLISAAFKRIKNILRQAEEKGFALGSAKDAKLSAEAQQLADAAAALTPQVAKLREKRNYREALTAFVLIAFLGAVWVIVRDLAHEVPTERLREEFARSKAEMVHDLTAPSRWARRMLRRAPAGGNAS